MTMAAPIDAAACFLPEDFAGTEPVVAAVSGGGDSLALLFLLHDFLGSRGEARRLAAVTVDHGLRAESAAEAAMVAQVCARHNIMHKTLCWQGDKPATALSHKARLARYDLLCAAAAAAGARLIVTGHTLDDQAETYTMRLQRGGGWGRGLAAMPRLALLQRRFCLLRPLLAVRRQALRRYLQGRGISWVDDPSNDDAAYERVRVRKGLDDDAVAAAQQAVFLAALARRRQAEELAALAAKLRMRLAGERLWFDLEGLAPAEKALLPLLFAFSAAVMGGRLYPSASRRQLEKLVSNGGRMTSARAVIEVTAKHARIWRENRAVEESVLPPGAEMVWDGRYRLRNHGRQAVTVRAASPAALQQVLAAAGDNIGNAVDLHRPSLASSCMIESGAAFALPVFGYQSAPVAVTAERIMQPFDWLVAGDDRALYAAFSRVFTAKRQENDKNWPQ